MPQLQTRAFGAHVGATCAGCGSCHSTSLRRAQCRTLPDAPPAQLRAASIAPLRVPRPALASPKPRVVMVEAKQRRKPTPFTPDLSVWQEGGCMLCDMEFSPVRRPCKAQSVAKRHYGGQTHHANEQHAELMLRTFDLHDVHQLLRCDYECLCGFQAWWRPMAIHLRESKECLAEMQSSGGGRIITDDSEDEDSEDADSSGEEDDNGYADDSEGADDSGGSDDDYVVEALEMPEEENFWRC